MNARVIPITLDTGTAYGLPPPSYKEELTEVGPGTPMGELLRRYWMPVAGVSEFAERHTKPIRLLGEELVLYKDLSGTFGLIDRQCPHRHQQRAATARHTPAGRCAPAPAKQPAGRRRRRRSHRCAARCTAGKAPGRPHAQDTARRA